MKINSLFRRWHTLPRRGELRIIPIGGLDGFGMNALIIHTIDILLIIDCGHLFSSEKCPGIDSIIPDFAYLEAFANRISAVLLTHGHEDHIGALPYLLERWSVAVYGSVFTIGMLKKKIREFGICKKQKLYIIDELTCITFNKNNSIRVEWIPVAHSVPDACVLIFYTPWGNIIHTGDYKLEQTSIDGQSIDVSKLLELNHCSNLALLSDVTNIFNSANTPNEYSCQYGIHDSFRNTSGKIFVIAFSSNIYRIQTIINLANKYGRKICLLGRSMKRIVALSRDLGYLFVPNKIIVNIKDINRIPSNKLVIICTGTQGEEMSALARITRNQVSKMKIKANDLMILSSKIIPGNETNIYRVLDASSKLGTIDTTMYSIKPVHATGHSHRVDLVMLIKALQPKYLIPVHGTYRHLKFYGLLATAIGYSMRNLIILNDGKCLILKKKEKFKVKGDVVAGHGFVKHGLKKFVDTRVVYDRLLLYKDGVIIITILLNNMNKDFLCNPLIINKGFIVSIYDKKYWLLICKVIKMLFENAPKELLRNNKLLMEFIRQSILRIIYKTTRTKPIIVIMLLDVCVI